MEDKARRVANSGAEAARRRLAQLKFASITASVLAFGGLKAAIAIEVSAAQGSASSSPAAPHTAPHPRPVAPVGGDDYYEHAAPGNPPAAPPQAANPAHPIVSAQS